MSAASAVIARVKMSGFKSQLCDCGHVNLASVLSPGLSCGLPQLELAEGEDYVLFTHVVFGLTS